MNKRKEPLLLLHANVIVALALDLGFMALTLIAVISPSTFGDAGIWIGIPFSILAIAASFVFGALLRYYSGKKRFLDSLRDENYYTLGIRSTFYNLEAFKDKVRIMQRRFSLRNKKRFILAFSPTATSQVGTSNRNRVLQQLNRTIATFITMNMYSKDNTKINKKNCVFAFDRNAFLFYLFVDDENQIHSLITYLSNECFRLVNEENYQIWVQPFSGICRDEEGISLTASIERALIAKTQSEQNIESFSYFKEGFMSKDTVIADDILSGIENKEFVPYYQPKYSLKEKRFISSEALARWKTPEGILPPIKFIDRAGRAGLLNKIDMAIFEASIKDVGDQLKRGRKIIPVSVNFSLYEFFSNNFVTRIRDVLQQNQVPPTLLEIEITETTSQVNKFLSLQVIKKLKDMGIRILMDDFGTGFSQIENLRQIPFDAIKIDKSFTDRIVDDEKIRSIVRFLIQLIHDNDMEAIVEGVETAEQVEILRKMKVDTIQGFYFSRPLPISEYQVLLKENKFEKKGARKWLS